MIDIKQHKKWIGLAITTPFLLYLAMPSSLFSSSTPNQTIAPPTVQSLPAPVMGQQTTTYFQPPTQKDIIMLTLDDGARDIVTKSAELKSATLSSAIEEATTKSWVAKQARKGGATTSTVIVPDLTVLGAGASLPLAQTTSPQPLYRRNLLDDVQLAGLVTAANGNTSAYLSLNGSVPFQINAGMNIRGVQVRSITARSVTLTDDTRTRHLTGGSYE
ncbi:hypothetical protein [Photobacterium indicum]|uniref:hypothetical protein n=1 Tax=Photobacterium indicum TaxID=81447 RepID=UPI003D0EE0FD